MIFEHDPKWCIFNSRIAGTPSVITSASRSAHFFAHHRPHSFAIFYHIRLRAAALSTDPILALPLTPRSWNEKTRPCGSHTALSPAAWPPSDPLCHTALHFFRNGTRSDHHSFPIIARCISWPFPHAYPSMPLRSFLLIQQEDRIRPRSDRNPLSYRSVLYGRSPWCHSWSMERKHLVYQCSLSFDNACHYK